MGIGLKAQKTLWGRAAGRCSIPDCRMHLFEDAEVAGDPTLVGENCHIVADSDNGPRADKNMPQSERDAYPNLILCCRNHHKVIDAQTAKYTVEVLKKIKGDHETWVIENLSVDKAKLQAEERYASYLDTWEGLGHIGDWTDWTSWLLGNGQPSIPKEVDNDLWELRKWLISRVWPNHHADLELSFTNFHRVLNDLQETYRSHMVSRDDELWTEKFYNIPEWDEARYSRLHKQFEEHVDLVQDLVLELTRAANLVCERVRATVFPNYRVSEGHLVVESGPDLNFKWTRSPALYSGEEANSPRPYPGLEKFKTERTQRDRFFGGAE